MSVFGNIVSAIRSGKNTSSLAPTSSATGFVLRASAAR